MFSFCLSSRLLSHLYHFLFQCRRLFTLFASLIISTSKEHLKAFRFIPAFGTATPEFTIQIKTGEICFTTLRESVFAKATSATASNIEETKHGRNIQRVNGRRTNGTKETSTSRDY